MKRKLALFLAVVAIITSVFAFAGCSKKDEGNDDSSAPANNTASDLAYVQNKGKLIIGMTEYKPMNYKENGEWTGFDTEFALAVCKKLGVEAEFVVLADWDQKFVELDSKSIDCVWNGMTITDEALKNASVTDAYVENAQVVVTKKDIADKYTSLDEMKELNFAVENGSAGHEVLKESGIKNVVAVTAQSDALTEVESGSADACVIDITMAQNMTGEGTSYSDLTQALKLNEEKYGIAFRKGSDLTAKVNEIMAEMMQDGTLDNLAKKYNLTLVK